MMKNIKKWLSILMCLATVLSVAVPGVSAEETSAAADDYVFPEFSKPVFLGEPLTGEMSITEDIEIINHNGKDYVLVAAKGGTLYVFKLTDFMEKYKPNSDVDPITWIHDQKTTGIDISRGLVGDGKGNFYVVGGANHMYVYNFFESTGYKVELPTTRGSVNDIAIDKDGNLYIALTPNVPQQPAQVLKVDTNDNNAITVAYETMDLDHTSAIICGDDGNVYTVGPARGQQSCTEVHKFNPANGEKLGTYFLDKTSFVLYLSYIDGVLFVGNSNAVAEGFVALDTKTMEKLDMGVDAWIMGCVPTPKNGVTYMMCSNAMVYKYDVASRSLSMVPDLVGVGLNLRLRNPWLENVSYGRVSGEAIFTMAAGGATPTLMSTEGCGFEQFPEMIEGAISPAQVRTVASGIPGILKNKVYSNGTTSLGQSEVAVYVGGFLTPTVNAYGPDMEEETDKIFKGFSNGHAQTDAMITYKNKIYAGCYSGGFIVEYDPVTDETRDLIPNGLYKDYDQVRLHALDAGDDKIFFGTIPTTGVYGGVVGWVDLITGEIKVIDKPAGELAFNSVCYDEATGLLYACGTTKVGQNTIINADEALMLVYDVKNDKKLGEYSCLSSRNPYSDMVWNLEAGDKLPPYIAGIAQDPDTGKIWGMVGRTLFSMYYDPAVGALRMHEEWAPPGGGGKSIYATGGALHWFSRPFMFDGNGYLYLPMESYGVIRFNLSDPSDNLKISNDGTRIMAMSHDGNIYFGAEGEKLYMIALGRTSVVKAMIDGTEPKDREGVLEAREAYEHLTDDERAELGEKYAEGIVALEGAADIFRQVEAERVDKAIDEIGAVTVTSAGAIMNARVAYDNLDDKGKTYVTKYDILQSAESAYSSISGKTQWGSKKTILFGFGGIYNPGANGVLLQNIQYGHTTAKPTDGTFDNAEKGTWEYATGTAKLNGRDHIQANFGGAGTNYLGLKVKVLETGIYDVSMDTLAYNGCIGALYMFPTKGLSVEELYTGITDEVTQLQTGTEHYVGSVDYTKEGQQYLGRWECTEPGEYVMVFGLIRMVDGAYARFKSVTMTKQDPVTDATVEMAKDKINAIGKVTKNSEGVIREARWSYDALTDAQRELIYAPMLEEKEAEFAALKLVSDADDAAAALAQIQIEAIGIVSAGSGPAIETAREAYDALTKNQKKLVKNYDKLTQAEAEYEKLTQQSGDVQPQPEGDNTMMYVYIGVGALALVLVVVLVIALTKKKKTSVGAD